MADNREVWAFSEKTALLAELVGGARSLAEKLGGKVVAVVAGPRADADRAAGYGADEVLWFGEPEAGALVEDIVPSLEKAAASRQPAVVLLGATKRGKAVAGRLAARLGTSVVTDVKELALDAGAVQAQHMIFGGGAIRVEKPRSATVLATAALGIYSAAAGGAAAPVTQAEFVAPAWKVTRRETKPKKVTTVNLAAAKRVVCPGRGFSKKEDLNLVVDLAEVLGAEIGCTRPLTEGLDWLPRERYIGVSGAFIKPELYIGIGLSGQVQHTVGVNDSRVIVAINKDEHAPIFKQADYGIVGDLYTIVPALVAALKARK